MLHTPLLLICLQIKSHEGGGCKVAESFCLVLSGHPLATLNFYSTYRSDSLGKRANPENLLLHKLFYIVMRMGQCIWSLNGGFVPEAEDQSCKWQVLFFALTHHKSVTLSMRSNSEGCEAKQIKQIIEIL